MAIPPVGNFRYFSPMASHQLSSLLFCLLGYLVDRLTVFGFGLMNDTMVRTILGKRGN